jgi:hypothetical protein
MPNLNYNNGRAREYRIMKRLEAQGWWCVRSAGSKGVVDIVAFKLWLEDDQDRLAARLKTRFIQAKPPGRGPGPEEREKLAGFEKRLGITIEVLS